MAPLLERGDVAKGGVDMRKHHAAEDKNRIVLEGL
jgi:hypothetical protein